ERAGHALSELPDRRVRADLWSSLFPGAPAGGANAVPGPLASSHLEWLWRRFYRPSAMSVVVVGEVPDTVIRSIFADWPTPPEPGPPPSLRPVQGGTAEVQTNAARVGLGRAARTGESGALAAAAELVAARLRAGGIAAAEAEVWWGPGRTALVVLGSALPDAPAASPESIRATIADLAADVTADLVAEAQRTLRRRLLYQARTARGLAAVIGTFHERTGAPDGAARFLDALDRVAAKAVGRILRALVERPDAVLAVGPPRPPCSARSAPRGTAPDRSGERRQQARDSAGSPSAARSSRSRSTHRRSPRAGSRSWRSRTALPSRSPSH